MGVGLRIGVGSEVGVGLGTGMGCVAGVASGMGVDRIAATDWTVGRLASSAREQANVPMRSKINTLRCAINICLILHLMMHQASSNLSRRRWRSQRQQDTARDRRRKGLLAPDRRGATEALGVGRLLARYQQSGLILRVEDNLVGAGDYSFKNSFASVGVHLSIGS